MTPSKRAPVQVITEAAQSPKAQLRQRQIRYAVLMGLRVVCLIVAAILVTLRVPYMVFWVVLLLIGMMVFPWMAVLIANDRPAKADHRLMNRFRRGPATVPHQNALGADDEPERPVLLPPGRTIDQ